MRQHFVFVYICDGRLQLVFQLPSFGYLSLDQLLAFRQLVGLGEHEFFHTIRIRFLVFQTLGHHLARVHAVGAAEERLVSPSLHHDEEQLPQFPFAVGHRQVCLVGNDGARCFHVTGPSSEWRQQNLCRIPGEYKGVENVGEKLVIAGVAEG